MRQSCSLSPLLCVLVFEVLSRAHPRVKVVSGLPGLSEPLFPISQYADDTSLISHLTIPS